MHDDVPKENDTSNMGKGTYCDFEDLLHAGAGGFNHGLDVLTAESGLLANGTLDEDTVLGQGDLAREEDLAVDLDSLRLYL